MGYDVSLILTPGVVQCGLAAALLYMVPLNKRDHFPARFLLGALAALLAAPLLKSYQVCVALLLRAAPPLPRLLGTALGAAGELFLTLLLIWSVVALCCRLKRHKALYCAVCAYLTQDIAYTIFVIILPDAANRGAHPSKPGTLWLELLILVLVCAFFFFTFARTLPEGGDFRFSCGKSLPAMLLIMYVSRVLGIHAKRAFDAGDSSTFRFMLVYDILLSITLLVTQLLQRQEERYRTAAALESQLWQAQKRQYDAFRENMDAINHKCHDLKYLIAALRREPDGTRKAELLQELEQDVMNYDSFMDTGSDVLDALLAETWINCRHREIQWTCMADGSAVRFLDPIDLYTMLGNALENAMEHTAQFSDPQKRFLCVNIWRKGQMAFLKVENYCERPPAFHNGLPVTTKASPSEHGYGLRSIQAVVSRYGGALDVGVEDHIFSLSAVLPIPPEEGR